MAGVTKLSISLPTELAREIKRSATKRRIPVSQLIAEELGERRYAEAFAQAWHDAYGPFTAGDHDASDALLATARTPQQVLRDAGIRPTRR